MEHQELVVIVDLAASMLSLSREEFANAVYTVKFSRT